MSTPLLVASFFAPEDVVYFRKMRQHLASLARQGEIKMLGDLPVGAEVREATIRQIAQAEVVLTLVSANLEVWELFYSFIWPLIQSRSNEILFIPIWLGPVNLAGGPLQNIKGLPADGHPVRSRNEQDRAWVEVAQGLAQAVAAWKTANQESAPGTSRSPFIPGPPIRRDEDFFGRRRQREELHDALWRQQPVQILGERRMGKSSLLLWLKRRVTDRPVVFVDASQLPGRSPSELVLTIAKGLGHEAQAQAALERYAEGPEARAAERVLSTLPPAVVLIDEAEALASAGHGFDGDFFAVWRSLGQAGKLVWISASRQDLYKLFRKTGMTSAFLNDARRVFVGQLEPDAAQALLARGLSRKSAELALAEAAGFAYGLQWLGDKIWRAPDEVSRVLDDFAGEMEDLAFAPWLENRSADELALLKGCVEPATIPGLPNRERKMARELAKLGFLIEEHGRFELPGKAWHRFIADV